MKYVKKITTKEFNEALERFYKASSFDEKSELIGLTTGSEDLLYSDINNNVFFLFQKPRGNFIYFAIDKNRPQNIRAMYELIYELANNGFDTIRIEGKAGRYEKILESFGRFEETECSNENNRAFMWNIGNPEVKEKLLSRVDK